MEEKIRTFRKGGGLSCRICCWGGIYHLCAVRCGFHGPDFPMGAVFWAYLKKQQELVLNY